MLWQMAVLESTPSAAARDGARTTNSLQQPDLSFKRQRTSSGVARERLARQSLQSMAKLTFFACCLR